MVVKGRRCTFKVSLSVPGRACGRRSIGLSLSRVADEKHPIRNSVIATLIAVGIIACLKFVPGLFKGLIAATAAFLRYMVQPVTIGRWFFVLLCLLSLIIVWRSLRPWLKRRKSTHQPRVSDYQTDQFFGAIWRWNYYGSSPRNLAAFCPTCDTQLVYLIDRFGRDRLWLTCEHCGTKSAEMEGTVDFFEGKVSRQIERVIRTGEWVDRLRRAPPVHPSLF